MDQDDLLYEGDVTVRAIPDRRGRFQPCEWFDALTQREHKRAQAGLDTFNVAFHAKRGYAGRLEKVEGSRSGLFELRLTRGGTRGPQLRFLGIWRGSTFYVALAVRKDSRRFRRGVVERADRIVEDWDADPKRKGR